MKRPLGLWIFLSAGVLWLAIQNVQGKRATSLIFAKTSTTTTPASLSEEKTDSPEESDTTEAHVEGAGNSTKSLLTGNPQIDYIWDPNLPKELNGYNLSDYPFYERVPENITFKCDGLHDGFYASVLYKCQVYHHCLFGIRYDFLCANYTAFDQTLFNCNFVSKVDCENSKKFWNRNDELYITKSTTPPPIVYSFYTQSTPVQFSSMRRIPPRRFPMAVPVQISAEAAPPVVTQAVSVQQVDIPIETPFQQPAEVPVEPRRRMRPSMRTRPYDYYDDYEDSPRYVRKRPRPRPYYDEDDYEYYDDRSYTRNEGRRRPYDRPMRRYKGRRDRYEYDEEYDDVVDRDDRYVAGDAGRRNNNRGVSTTGNNRYNQRRKPSRMPQSTSKPSRRPTDVDYEEYEDTMISNKRPRPDLIRNRNPTSKGTNNEYDHSQETNNKKNINDNSSEFPLDDTKTMIRPNSGTIFDQPRVAPKINLPVPKNVANKYSYKTVSAKTREDNNNEQEETATEQEEISSSSTETSDTVASVRGNVKRPFMSRRPTTTKAPNRKVQPNEEFQESQTNAKDLEGTEISKKGMVRSGTQERTRGTSRVNVYKLRHSLSTPDKDLKSSVDLTEVDDSINEA